MHLSEDGATLQQFAIQPLGSKAKAYQVKQVRNLIVKYKLAGENA